MNNFEVLNNIDDNKSLMIIDENKLAIDDRYFVSYREKYDIDNILKIIKGTITGKICIKEMIYKNEDELININKALHYVFGRIELMALNNIYTENEKEKIINMLMELILLDKSMNKKILNLKEIKYVEEKKNKIKNETITSTNNNADSDDDSDDEQSDEEYNSYKKYTRFNKRKCGKIVNRIIRSVSGFSRRIYLYFSSAYILAVNWLNRTV